MTATIYYNPNCSTCQKTLALMHAKNVEPEIIKYLEEPLGLAELEILFSLLDLENALDIIRVNDSKFQQADVSENSSTEEVMASITRYPELLQRPIVVTDKGARICRPPELVEEIL